ncbi:MAG: TolC family protein [Nitrospiria bacterium]
MREATQNNPDLAAARAAVHQAKFQYQASYGNFFPQLSLDAVYDRANSPINLRQSTAGSDIQEQYSLGLTARQSLFSGLRNKAEVERTRGELEAVEANLSTVKAQVSYDLKSAFTQVLFAQEQLKLAEAIASRRKENVRLVEIRYEAGREHKGSFLLSKADYRQAEFEVSQARREVKVAQRQLTRALGRSESDEIAVSGDFKVSPTGMPQDFHALALQTPVYLQPAAQTRAAQASVIIARGHFYPEIAATGSVSRLGEEWPPDTNRWGVGAVLSFPIFTGGRDYFGLRSAKAEERRAQENLKSTEDRILLELEQTFASLQDGVERAEVQKEFLDAAGVRAEIARKQYTSGLLSFEDWDIIENDLISTQKQVIASQRDMVIAEADWERAQGRGSIP